ncbi:MAG: HupE/UreJ family protein [Paracoccaceae bacterium]
MTGKLSWGWLKSSLLVLLAGLFLIRPLAAHEVQPAVADAEVGAEALRLEIRLTLEALAAGVDLNGLGDTNESPLSGFYDQKRRLPPDALEQDFRARWGQVRQGIVIESGGVRVTPEILDLRIPEVGNPELPRESVLVLGADLPPGDAPVRIGWWAQYGPLVLRQAGEGDELYTGYLTGGALSDPLPRQGVAQVGALREFGRYVVLGIEHIVPKGLDHILFVLGLFFFSLHVRPLLMQVTAFTLAHTTTLALAVLGLVSVPAAIVEPLIAASITYVAVENVLHPRLSWWRTVIVFGFGLLHGLGFASVLGEIGLDPGQLIAGLIGFNVGVEIGQLVVIAAAFFAVGYWFGDRPWYRARIAVPASVAIALVGAWWVVQRVFL